MSEMLYLGIRIKLVNRILHMKQQTYFKVVILFNSFTTFFVKWFDDETFVIMYYKYLDRSTSMMRRKALDI